MVERGGVDGEALLEQVPELGVLFATPEAGEEEFWCVLPAYSEAAAAALPSDTCVPLEEVSAGLPALARASVGVRVSGTRALTPPARDRRGLRGWRGPTGGERRCISR